MYLCQHGKALTFPPAQTGRIESMQTEDSGRKCQDPEVLHALDIV